MASALSPAVSPSELERQYSSSQWSHRGDSQSVLKTFFATMSTLSDEARRIANCTRDVAYGTSEGEKLDIYRGERSTEDSEVFVFIHGGYWQECSKDTHASMVGPLTSRGAVVVIVGYDLAPKVRLAIMVEQVEKAVAYVIGQFPRSRGIYLGGHSAGGHLAAMMMSVDWRGKYRSDLVRGFCLISGVFDVTPLVHTSVNRPLNLDHHEAKQSSPVQFLEEACLRAKRCSVLVVVAEHDSPAMKRQSTEYAQGLKVGGVKVQCLEIENEDHFSIVEKLNQKDFILSQKIIHLMQLV